MRYLKEHSDRPLAFISIEIIQTDNYEDYLKKVKKALSSTINMDCYPGLLWLDRLHFDKYKEILSTYPDSYILCPINNKKYDIRNPKGYMICPSCNSTNILDEGPVWYCKDCGSSI